LLMAQTVWVSGEDWVGLESKCCKTHGRSAKPRYSKPAETSNDIAR